MLQERECFGSAAAGDLSQVSYATARVAFPVLGDARRGCGLPISWLPYRVHSQLGCARRMLQAVSRGGSRQPFRSVR
jgi:hypothetical protein